MGKCDERCNAQKREKRDENVPDTCLFSNLLYEPVSTPSSFRSPLTFPTPLMISHASVDTPILPHWLDEAGLDPDARDIIKGVGKVGGERNDVVKQLS